MVQIFRVDFRHGEAVAAKMFREFQEGDVLFPHIVENSNGRDFPVRQAHELTLRAAQAHREGLRLSNG